MKYYSPGDYIYVFGFSRGAYTARFLAEMIHDIGLLSQGNEEMIRFVYSTFSEAQKAKGSSGQSQKDLERKEYMRSFREAFCRPHMMVHFLGLFDCVNSVGQFEIPFRRKSYRYLGKVRSFLMNDVETEVNTADSHRPSIFVMPSRSMNDG